VPVGLNKRTLIGTVGYQLLSNHSIGPVLLPQIKEMPWPENVEVEEMNWGPIAIVQYFQTLEIPFDKVVFLVALERPHREIGDINIYQWMGRLPSETQIQACIGDAATGVISVENLLVIGEFFKIWPKEVYLLDVEPGPEQAGEFLTNEIVEQVPIVLKKLNEIVLNGVASLESLYNLTGDTIFNEINEQKGRH
jgi:Ni,Fe-hydrogenase maturation factor